MLSNISFVIYVYCGVFNATLNNISVSGQFMVDEIGIPGENYRPAASQ
jgi:hypothetical protein